MLTLSKREDRKCALSGNSQEALSFIADEERGGNITDAQAEALRKFLMSMYLGEYLQTVLELAMEEFVEKTQLRLEYRFDDLLEHISHLEWG